MSKRLLLFTFSWLIAGLACSLPSPETAPPTEAISPIPEGRPTPTPLPPLPPTLVEHLPPSGSAIHPQGAITLFFDQTMDRLSVEAALQLDPATDTFADWLDERTLRVQPTSPLQRGIDYRLIIGTEARSQAGLTLLQPIEVPFHTPDDLQITQVLPEPDAVGVNPNNPIMVVFSRPVVPLEIDGAHPQPLSLDPSVSGEGEWIDTSIFLFRPTPQFPGGATLNVQVDAGLTDLTGGILSEPFLWSFTTTLPEVISSTPFPNDIRVSRDRTIVIDFNQAMDPQSVEDAFRLSSTTQSSLPGSMEWNEGQTQFTFSPTDLLDYSTRYTVRLSATVKSIGGYGLSKSFQASFTTMSQPRVITSSPRQGGQKPSYTSVEIEFSGPMDRASLFNALDVAPPIEGLGSYWRSEENTLVIFGDYQPSTEYNLRISEAATDPYFTPLASAFSLNFTTSALSPSVGFTRYSQVISLSTDGPQQVEVNHRNTTRLDFSLYRLNLTEFFELTQTGTYGLQELPGEYINNWSLEVTGELNQNVVEKVSINQEPLPTGVYLLTLDSPNDNRSFQAQLLLIRRVELVIKSTTEAAFVWAVDLSDGKPISLNPIKLANEVGGEIATGVTDPDGVTVLNGDFGDDPYARLYAISAAPGDELFGLTSNAWASGIHPYNFGVSPDLDQPEYKLYLYTDRPIYRPGQTVRFRGVLRQTDAARYLLPDLEILNVTLQDIRSEIIDTQSASISEYGTFHGEFVLSEGIELGTYSIETDHGQVFFDVAAYRKPEFTVSIEPSVLKVASGDPLSATIRAEYFFGGPVIDADVRWTAWLEPYYPPGLPQPIDWFGYALGPQFDIGYESFASGDGVTDENGQLVITLPTSLDNVGTSLVMIEATLTDSTGFPVTGRGSVELHPATVYLTLTPERYALRVGETAIVGLESTDWESAPIPRQEVEIRVERLTWRQALEEDRLIWTADTTLVNRVFKPTDESGLFRFSFVPEQAGTYRVTAIGEDPQGRQTMGHLTMWVSGIGVRLWRQPPAGRLALVPDKASYQPGDVAKILVPSPYAGVATALITIERGSVLSHQVIELDGSDTLIEVPIEDHYAPNVFLSVVLIHSMLNEQPASVAVGLIELSVAADSLELQVTLTPDRTTAAPGESITYQIEARDNLGNPVQAEFSLALTDLAALSLAPPNSLPPFEAFYGPQPLRVRTGVSLSMSGDIPYEAPEVDGVGGGGGEAALYEVRREFPDTAFWSATIVTDTDGRAQVALTLPDSLTTWRMDTRGITLNTLIGSDAVDLLVTKDLFIRPVTPRFFTAGDAATVAGVVHNNTSADLTVDTQLLASGAEVTSPPSFTGVVPAGGQTRFEWRLTIQDVDAVDLSFQVSGGGLQDASKPTVSSAVDGTLHVLQFSAPDTAATAGALENAGERLEVLNLPRRFIASQGVLKASLDPSLGSAMYTALEALELTTFRSTEAVISRFLPNLAALRALQTLDIDESAMESRLNRTLTDGIQFLISNQQEDGGWGWWSEGPSNTYLTAYALFALSTAREAGVQVSEEVIDSASQYLFAGIVPPEMLRWSSGKNQQAFVLYVLAISGQGDLATTRQMLADRSDLDLWARALLALTLEELSQGDEGIAPILSDFETAAVRTATGAHWEEATIDRWNMGSAVRTTANVLQALVVLDRDNPLIPAGVRWLLSARNQDGDWSSTHETAWSLFTLSDWLAESGGLDSSFDYDLALNGQSMASGSAIPGALSASVTLAKPIGELLPDQPNQLTIQRGTGEGTLFYTAHLTVYRPIPDVQATSRGLSIQRGYFLYDGSCGGIENTCTSARSASVGDDILVRVTLVVPSEQYYIVVEDPYPAGTEPLDTQLLTTPTGGPINFAEADFTPSGWGGWWFTKVAFGDDHLALFADFLPAGTYQYTYLLRATLPGEYRVLPPRTWAVYFPEVYAHGDGQVYSIQP